MYSPINYMKNYFLPDYISSNDKTPKGKVTKNKSNSLNSKKLILSRNNNISKKNLILKTKTNNNSEKQINLLNNQFSFESVSLTRQKIKEDTFNSDSLYKYLSSKIKENNSKNLNHRKKNDIKNNSEFSSTKIDFNISQIKSMNKVNKGEKNKFNKYKGVNKANKTSQNYYKKILNFPLSPGNKNVKVLKLNNLNMNEVASSFHILNNDKEDLNYKRILSSQNLFNDKQQNNSDSNNKINSFICHNTNNINLNVNIINKGIILNSYNDSSGDINNNKSSFGLNKKNNLTHRNVNKHNKEIYNLSSYRNISINKENNCIPEEIHFKAVKYMQEIKYFDGNYT